jgi:lysophospholipase L1-like esterase
MRGFPFARGLLAALVLVSCMAPDKGTDAPVTETPPGVPSGEVPEESPPAPLAWEEHPADEPRLQYTGRVDWSSSAGPTAAFPGVTVRLRCACTDVDVAFEDLGTGGAEHTNFLDLRVDGVSRGTLQARPGEPWVPGVRDLPPGEHTVELVKRTEAYAGAVRFRGVRVRGALLEPPARPARRIEFVGDSITCGYGDEASIAAPTYTEPNTGYHARNQDVGKAHGPLTAQRLGAEWVTTCVSGRGVYRNNDGSRAGVLPLVYRRTLPDSPTPTWDPRSYVPDVLVVNLGTNDFSVNDASGLPSAPPSEPFQQAYAAFVRELRATYPSARIVCAVGPMLNDSYPPGRQAWTRLRRDVSALVSTLRAEGDTRVHAFAFTPMAGDPYGEDWHPTAAFHARMADELVPFLQGLGW